MKFRLAAILALVFSSFGSYSQVMPYGNIRDYADRPSREYREALRLYNKGMYDNYYVLYPVLSHFAQEVNFNVYDLIDYFDN